MIQNTLTRNAIHMQRRLTMGNTNLYR